MNIHVSSFDSVGALPREELNALFERINSAANSIINALGARDSAGSFKRGFSSDGLQKALSGSECRDFMAGNRTMKINQNTHHHSATLKAGRSTVHSLEIFPGGITNLIYVPVDDKILTPAEARETMYNAQKAMFSTFNEIAFYRALASIAEKELHNNAIHTDHPERTAVKKLRDEVDTLAVLVMQKMGQILGEKFQQEAPHWEQYTANAEKVYVHALEAKKLQPSTSGVTDPVAQKMSQSSDRTIS